MSDSKVALVTGSSSGIGLATAKLLASKGYKVAVTGSNKTKVDSAARECAEASPTKSEPLKLVLDFTSPDNGVVAVEETVKHFGKLDVLVNNAGIFIRTAATDPTSYEAYRNCLTINTDSTVKCTLAAVKYLEITKGNIIFVSSVASVKPSESGYAYCMSKAAMSQFARCLALDLAPNIRVNIVSPGPVLTPIFARVGLTNDKLVEQVFNGTTLSNRIGKPEEIASAIAYLVSDEAAFVNGHEMIIDGGYIIKPSNLKSQIQAVNQQ